MATKFSEMPLTFPEVESYFKRLKFFIEANDKQDVDKSVLLSSCGEEAFSLIETLISPYSITSGAVSFNYIETKSVESLETQVYSPL